MKNPYSDDYSEFLSLAARVAVWWEQNVSYRLKDKWWRRRLKHYRLKKIEVVNCCNDKVIHTFSLKNDEVITWKAIRYFLKHPEGEHWDIHKVEFVFGKIKLHVFDHLYPRAWYYNIDADIYTVKEEDELDDDIEHELKLEKMIDDNYSE